MKNKVSFHKDLIYLKSSPVLMDNLVKYNIILICIKQIKNVEMIYVSLVYYELSSLLLLLINLYYKPLK